MKKSTLTMMMVMIVVIAMMVFTALPIFATSDQSQGHSKEFTFTKQVNVQPPEVSKTAAGIDITGIGFPPPNLEKQSAGYQLAEDVGANMNQSDKMKALAVISPHPEQTTGFVAPVYDAIQADIKISEQNRFQIGSAPQANSGNVGQIDAVENSLKTSEHGNATALRKDSSTKGSTANTAEVEIVIIGNTDKAEAVAYSPSEFAKIKPQLTNTMLNSGHGYTAGAIATSSNAFAV